MSKATLENKVTQTVHIAIDTDSRLCGHQHLRKLSAFSCGFNSFGKQFYGVQSLSPAQRRKLADD